MPLNNPEAYDSDKAKKQAQKELAKRKKASSERLVKGAKPSPTRKAKKYGSAKGLKGSLKIKPTKKK